MNKRIVGALALLVIGLLGILGLYYAWPRIMDREQRQTSNAKDTQGSISIALDNWTGYFILRSPEMKQQLRRQGWLLKVEDDNSDLPGRMKKLAEGQIDFAVATIDSYILNAIKLNYPGVIVAVIDESKGGDAILARKEKVSNLDQVKTVPDLRIAFTPDSPSHFLAKAAAFHFNVPELLPKDKFKIETKGSEEALKKLLAGKTDIAVLWEPDVSKALRNKDIVKILGTEDTERLIVDVLLVSRKFSKDRPDTVKQFLSTYFQVLKLYSEDLPLLTKHLMQETTLPEDSVIPMLKGVKWVNLTENCERWFGISSPGMKGDEDIISTIESTVGVLKSAGDFANSPLPNGDPYRIIYSTYLEELFLKGTSGFASKKGKESENSLEAKFAPLDEAQWDKLKEIRTLKVDVNFQHGDSQMDLMAREAVDKSVDMLKHYPHFRVIIRGHTDTRGDPGENVKMSQERADTVAKYLQVTYSIDPNRLRAIGLGGTKPLPKTPGETLRSWAYRLPRVELVLVREEL
jgi:outer membrane protein OmpA-like peptidoglycan-associated protein